MRSLLALLAVALLSVGSAACGGAGKGVGSTSQTAPGASASGGATSTTASSGAQTAPGATSSPSSATEAGRHHKDSDDGDNDPESNDDNEILDYGHAANAADKRAITAVLTSYYAAGAADDGPEGCKLLYSLIAETIPEEFTAPDLRGPTCEVVMSKLFKQHQQQLSADHAALKVTRVRVNGGKGLALLNLGKTPESHMLLHREGAAWRVESLLEGGMP